MPKWLLPRTALPSTTAPLCSAHNIFFSLTHTYTSIPVDDENCKSLLLTMFVWECTMFSACPNTQIDVQCSCVAICVCTSFHILFETLKPTLVPVLINFVKLCVPSQKCYLCPSYNQQLQLCAQCSPRTQFHQVLCSLIEKYFGRYIYKSVYCGQNITRTRWFVTCFW